MVKQRRGERCFVPAAVNNVSQVRFPIGRVHHRPPSSQQVPGRTWPGPGTGSCDSRPRCSSTTIKEDGGELGLDGGSGETKRVRLDGTEQAATLTNRDKVPGSSGQPGSESLPTPDGVLSRRPPSDQQGAAELSEDSRAAELQTVGSLKVTIQQRSESREFGQTDRTAERQTGGLHCHICQLTCRSLQEFQDHMTSSEHLRKLNDITQNICLNAHKLQDRGRRPDLQRWCDTCQTHFSGDIIAHRRTEQHKMCKKLCRPFCPVCRRHFRTPRKFVEHMKSAEHKEQVLLDDAQEEELITLDAVGCFEDEEENGEELEVADEEESVDEEPEEKVEEKEEEEEEEEEEAADTQETRREEEYDAQTTYGSSFVVPVSGFLCRLCNKFFHQETTARHTHCRTRTHYLNLQNHRIAQKRRSEDEDRSALS